MKEQSPTTNKEESITRLDIRAEKQYTSYRSCRVYKIKYKKRKNHHNRLKKVKLTNLTESK